jgi:hypothetical protein
VSGYQIVWESTSPTVSSIQAANATCPAGKKVLGGGAYLQQDRGGSVAFNQILLHSSAPSIDGSSWGVQATDPNVNLNTVWHMNVFAICADVGA